MLAIQVNADDHEDSLKVLPMDPIPVAQVEPAPVWAPSSGFADLIESVSPAVVHVATSGFIDQSGARDFRNFRFPPGWEEFFRDFQDPRAPDTDQDEGDDDATRQKRPLGIGSGFIISAGGYVVTNHHVISRADEIVVTLTDGQEYQADIVGSDPKTDLALLQLRDASDLPFVVWGDDEKSRVGDWVLAIGNPFGLGGSASTGIISARGRDIRSGPYDDYIQVDAAINRGNSGGPLFNTKGQVIGINTAIYSPNGGSVGIGFSIPASMAKGIIRQLQDNGEVSRGWIGVGIQEIDKDLADSLGRDNDSGALITYVEPEAPAARADLKVGDIILKFDGKPIDEMRDLPRIVADAPVGGTYRIELWRDGEIESLTIKTDRFPDEVADSDSEPAAPAEPEVDNEIDAELSAITGFERQRFRLDDTVDGVVLVSVERGGLAAANGLRAGDVISQLDGSAVSSPSDVTEKVREAKKAGRDKVSMLLIRGGSPRFLAFNLDN